MSFQLTFRDAMSQLHELAQSPAPAYIRRDALTTLTRQLSPAHPRHQEVLRALQPPSSPNPAFPELPLTPQQRTAFHLHPVEPDLAGLTLAEILTADDELGEEADDPW